MDRTIQPERYKVSLVDWYIDDAENSRQNNLVIPAKGSQL